MNAPENNVTDARNTSETPRPGQTENRLTLVQWLLLFFAFFMGVAATRTLNQALLSQELSTETVQATSTDR